jgi:branched-chain amino acid transport system ATP-binding protein
VLEVSRISVFYGDLQALWNVSLRIDKGGLVAVIGANGAGKTTLLKTISGLLHPRSGTIHFLGKRIDKLTSDKIVKMGVAHVPEGRRLFPYLTVYENLLMGAYASRDAWRRRFDTLEWIYELFPILEERREQLAGTLSGGEAQMLAIARGLMARPKLLMLDEPSLGLAPKLVLKLFDIIKKIHDEGVTILLVEQNIYNALKLADRGYVLVEGRVVLEGAGKELLADEQVKKAYLRV